MRASIYARISKDREGAGLGVGRQEADCRQLAATLGASIRTVHTDNDISAYSGKPRPGYRALLAEIESGDIDSVLVWHTDRLHRSPTELEQYIAVCEGAGGVTTHTVKAGNVDLSTASGRMIARQLGNIARYEIEHAIERMKSAKKQSAEAGEWKGGRRPFGYEADGVTIRESEAVLIRSAADAILAGASVQSVARDWNAAGSTTTTGKPWSLAAPRRILLRPRNAGLMEHQGEVIGPAEWPAILEPEKWRAVVRVLTDPNRRTNVGPSARKWLGSGIYRCGECGGPLRASSRAQGQRVYRCNGGHVVRGQAEVDELVSGVIVERLRRPDVRDLLKRTSAAPDVAALESRAVLLRQRLDQLAGMFAEGTVDAQQLASGTKALNAELDDVREQIAAAYRGTAFEEVADSPDPGAAWLDASLDRRRAVLASLLDVTVHKAASGRPAGWKPGTSYFRPETVQITWKGADTP